MGLGRGLGWGRSEGLAFEVVEDGADGLGVGDGAEDAHAAAALGAFEDVDAKGTAHELDPSPVAGR